ncbi:MAG: TIGR03118 family protein [Acidobacteriota bacterium]|nr:TIGR03118 family protein [Acidobacteriota bacterium]MDQ2843633.1 TIGR03118 family protein [Acidobacteriota bacterium]
MNRKPFVGVGFGLPFAVFLVLGPHLCVADSFRQTNLVSDVPGLARVTDANLKNSWGVAFSPTSPFWISNQGTSTSTLYDGAGTKIPLVVSIPGGTPPSGPTGQVFNGTTSFGLPDGKPAPFIFDTLNGTIAGWNGGAGTSAVQVASNPGAIYTGLALASAGSSNYLYAADSTGQIRVFDSSFKAVTLAGNFSDPHAIAGYVPFNIQLLNSKLYVTYAQLTAQGAGLPGGYVDVFDTNGNFSKRLATGGPLDAPWGLAMAPAGFGSLANDLLVGNFGNGQILAYDSSTGAYVTTLTGEDGKPLVNDFLWALETRTGGTNNDRNAVYFTAGINKQSDGLFGEITATPEPATGVFLVLGMGGLALFRFRDRKI